MIDLSTSYLGLPLSGPVIASAGPLTGRVDDLVRLEAAGAAAAVLPSLFEEEVVAAALALEDALSAGRPPCDAAVVRAVATGAPGADPDRHLHLVEEAKRRLTVPVVASVNAAHSGPWERYAGLLAEAGADAVELNVYAMAADPTRSGADVEEAYLDVVRRARAAVPVPLAVKMSPYFSSLPHMAAAVVATGVDGLVLFNRYYLPRLDLRTLASRPTVQLSMPTDLRLPLRWLPVLRRQLAGTSLAVSSGVDGVRDVLTALLLGADVACMTSSVLRRGTEHVAVVVEGLATCLEEAGYETVAALRGAADQPDDDPAARDRADYVEALARYQPTTS